MALSAFSFPTYVSKATNSDPHKSSPVTSHFFGAALFSHFSHKLDNHQVCKYQFFFFFFKLKQKLLLRVCWCRNNLLLVVDEKEPTKMLFSFYCLFVCFLLIWNFEFLSK